LGNTFKGFTMKVIASDIGTKILSKIPGWPSNDLEGLFDALARWDLDPRLDLSNDPEFAGKPGVAPFRGLAWGHCVQQYDRTLDRRVWVATKPIYPEHPNAVRYCGNFLGYSFGFWLDTDDPELIDKLDRAIADNLRRYRDRMMLASA
jgi:hypothetical protein